MRKRKMITFRGETKWATEWAQIMGIPPDTLYWRLTHGYSVEDALTMPGREKKQEEEKPKRKRYIDRTGQRYGMLTVIEYVGSNRSGALWRCKCDCGGERIVSGHSLRDVKNCGCQRAARRKSSFDTTQMNKQPCWSCQNYAGGCSWSRKNPKPVKGWKAVPTTRYQGTNGIMHSYEILYCPEYISDGTESRGDT